MSKILFSGEQIEFTTDELNASMKHLGNHPDCVGTPTVEALPTLCELIKAGKLRVGDPSAYARTGMGEIRGGTTPLTKDDQPALDKCQDELAVFFPGIRRKQ